MSGSERGGIIAALARLSVEQITTSGQAISANRADYCPANTSGYQRARLIKALVPLSAEKINVIGNERARIIKVVDPFSVERINLISNF